MHGETMFADLKPIDEPSRIDAFNQIYGKWPLPQWSSELSSYTEAMAAREREAMAHTTRGDKWKAWADLVQARAVPNMTERQFDVTQIPKHIHDKLFKTLHDSLATAPAEGGGHGVGGKSKKIIVERLAYEILDELKPMHEEWAGVPLDPSAAYGIRIYENGSTMVDHVDIVETHVISSVLHIDHDIDEDFPLEVQDAGGEYGKVNLKPGDMVFYESAKCFHRRSIPLKGRFHANIFLHYRPKNWLENMLTRDRIRLMVPPHWEGRHEAVTVSFTLSPEAQGEASLFWLGGDRQENVHSGDLRPGATLSFNTHSGHVWVARSKEDPSVELGRYFMGVRQNMIHIPWKTKSVEL